MKLDIDQIIKCFKKYTTFSTGNRPPSRKEFLINTEEKEQDPNFTGDMEALLRTGIAYNQEKAFEWLKSELINKI
ncbi:MULTISPECIES: hypothetical protein [Flavobacteriaceae]|uniref:YozE SAM-like domain-containing protein n=1 Tax=Croceitalea marina TaxID=1775166 RepID=A0ABW5MVJ4_9FLAO|nr:hypothetical protein [Allomuricauda pacifica]